MGSIWDRQDPGGPQVGPMNFAIWLEAVAMYRITPSPKTHLYIAQVSLNQVFPLFTYQNLQEYGNENDTPSARCQHSRVTKNYVIYLS